MASTCRSGGSTESDTSKETPRSGRRMQMLRPHRNLPENGSSLPSATLFFQDCAHSSVRARFVQAFFGTDQGPFTKRGSTRVDGTQVVGVMADGPGTMYVAERGPHYIVGVQGSQGTSSGSLRFSAYGDAVHAVKPTGAVNLGPTRKPSSDGQKGAGGIADLSARRSPQPGDGPPDRSKHPTLRTDQRPFKIADLHPVGVSGCIDRTDRIAPGRRASTDRRRAGVSSPTSRSRLTSVRRRLT